MKAERGERAARTAAPKAERNAPIYVKVLLTLHIVAICLWAMPLAPSAGYAGNAGPPWFDVGGWLRLYNQRYMRDFPPLKAYLFESGTWQYWDMFSPNPAYIDTWVDSEITYKNGERRYYLYPRMYLLPIPNKYAQERYRKYLERAAGQDFAMLWPQFALRIAYLNDNPKNPPWSVRLYRHQLQIKPPGTPQPTQYDKVLYFEYAVDQKMLRRMREE